MIWFKKKGERTKIEQSTNIEEKEPHQGISQEAPHELPHKTPQEPAGNADHPGAKDAGAKDDVLKREALLNMLEDLEETKKKLQESEQETRKSETFTKSMIENAGIPVIAFRKEDGALILNREFFSMTGYMDYEVDDIKKLFKRAFPHKLVAERVKEAFSKVYKDKVISDLVIPIMCKNGITKLVVCNMTPIKDEKDNVFGEVIFMRDISRIFELEKQIRFWVANGFTQAKTGDDEETRKPGIETSGSSGKRRKKPK